MRRRLPHLPRELLLLAAAACVVVGVFLALVAVDVARSHSAINDDDVRFAAGAPTSGWSPRALAPFDAGERVLGVRDDVAFRQMLRVLRASRLLDFTVSDPVLAVKRTELAERLESIVAHDPDPVLRSRASSLLGVVSVSSWNSTPPQGTQQLDRSELLLAAVASFEQAIALRSRERRCQVQPSADAAARQGSAADRGRGRQEPIGGRQGIARSRSRRARQRVLMEVTLLTPLGALIALGVVVPLVALALLHRRGESVRRAIGLPEPRPRVLRAAVAAVVVAAALLGLAAAQPRLEWTSDKRVRDDAEAIVVLDTSRSMLARTSPRSPIRYARATAAARRFRAAFPDVPVGIASFTDRVLPHLFPSPDDDVFAATLEQVARHRPAAAARLVRLDSDPARRARVDRQPPLLHPDRPQAADLRDHRRRERPDRRREDRRRVPAPAGRRHDLPARLGRGRAGLQREPARAAVQPGSALARHSRRGGRHARRPRLRREPVRRSRSRPPGASSATARRSCEGEKRNRLALAPYLAGAIFLPLTLLLWRRDR